MRLPVRLGVVGSVIASIIGSGVLSAALAGLASCASPPPPKPPPPREEPAPAPEPEPEPAGPQTWSEVQESYGSKCPGPFFELPEPTTIETVGRTFTITGSTLKLEGGPWQGPLKIGVLGAIKDAEYDTRQNLKKAARMFKAAGVQFVVANGDLVGDETGDLAKVVRLLGEEIKVPVFAHSGNYEWTTAFTEAFVEANKTHPHLFNMNLLRHVDLGGVHLFSLPGWSNRKYVKAAACWYGDDDIEALEARMKPLTDKGEVVILTAHGPPRGRGKQSIDFAHEAGNVGDESLARLLSDVPVHFGIFSHILEAGGRATDDVVRQKPIKLPMRRPVDTLYVNAGSASSYGWQMLNKKTSRGMAAIYVVNDIENGGKARVSFLKLR